MLTRAPRVRQGQYVQPRKRRIWLWAAGSIIAPLIVIAVTLLGARAVARARLAREVTPAQSLAPLDVTTVIQPASGASSWTLTTSAQGNPEIVALGGQALSTCLPPASCADQKPSTRYLAYDATTGAQLLAQPIGAKNMLACSAPDGSPSGMLYVMCGDRLFTFSVATGRAVAQYTLPHEIVSPNLALDVTAGALYLVGGNESPDSVSLLSYDLTSGTFVAKQGLTGGALSSPIADSADGSVLVVENNGGAQPTLVAFAARTLAPLGAVALPAWTRAGPFETAADTLFLFGPHGAVGAINLSQTPFSFARPAPATQVTPFGPLTGAGAIGFDPATQTLVALYANSVTAYDAESLKPYASAPVSGVWNGQRALPVDAARGVVYAPDASGVIVGLRLAPPSGRAAQDPATAIALARAGLGPLLPKSNQKPPFVSYQTFPLTQTTAPRAFSIYSPGIGWSAPYTGTASAKVVSTGAQMGDYTVEFTITWNQLFAHSHTWTVELMPDGRVRMISDNGDDTP